ncbi:MAG: Hsp20/alpha crystallin family protein [Patescibacteria group bacterium]
MTSFLSKLAGIKDEPQKNNSSAKDNWLKPDKEGSDWLDENYEGQLSVDVYSTDKEIVIKSTIAGVQSEDIDISVNNDMLTIRGERAPEDDPKMEEYYYQECYWGSFSRSIILPVEVDSDKVNASLKNGVLTIRLPKVRKTKNISVKIKEE